MWLTLTIGLSPGGTWTLFDHLFGKKIILSFDVEDNFTLDELAEVGDWEKYEYQVVENTEKVIQLLHQINADATFFVLGKVAERHPEIVQMIDKEGFEVSSHGYAHEPVDQMTKEEFEEDLKKSISIIEGITSKKVKGYRARSFSITRDTLWAFEILKRNGLEYDSSLTETELSYLSSGEKNLSTLLNGLREIPVCNKSFMGKKWAISGGIVFRLFLFPLYRFLLEFCCVKNSFKIIYAHVWEFNKDQPKRKIGFLQSIAQSPVFYTTETKIRKLSKSYDFISIQRSLELKQNL